ncbi:adenylate cyclase, class 1 [Gammaproteobacteria bacterium]
MALNFFKKGTPERNEVTPRTTISSSVQLNDLYDPDVIKKRFLRINQERLNRTQDSLRLRQKDFIDLLPLLFHINHPLLPGYLSKATPCGISDYQPSQNSLKAVRQFLKVSVFNSQLLSNIAIYSIFIMGSVGTVAYSEKSDLDIWLCYNPILSNPEIFELAKKAKAIEEWARTIELKIHFFLMDAPKFKIGESGVLSGESSGTAQHHLLLEEFYRTGLFVAGRYPAWWMIPPELEKDYDKCLQLLTEKRFISADDIIDFGGLIQVPAEEFVGAGLWQIYKGIDSPYKSILKIMLMENYADEYPNIDLLCLRYKKAVYAGTINLDQLDPYIMLINKLEEYLNARNEPLRLDLVRRCFYIKINVALSFEGATRVVGWRRDLMKSLVDGWGWDKNQIKAIDSRETWRINYILKERSNLHEELKKSYRFLSNFGREHTQLSSISDGDRHILGRKLFVAFESKIEKIDIVYHGIANENNLLETHLTIQQSSDQECWLLFNSEPNTQKKELIKQAPSVITLLAWGHFNKIICQRTMIALQTRSSILDTKELNAILRCLKEFAPEGKLPLLETDNFKKSSKMVSAILFINIGIDPMARYNRAGADLISNRGDILNYGNSSFNLAVTCDLLMMTNCQEVLNFSYKETHALIDGLCKYLSWFKSREDKSNFPPPKIYSFSSSYAISLTRRIEDLFREAQDFFLEERITQIMRYLLKCGNLYYLLYIENDEFHYLYKNTLAELQRMLNEPNQHFMCLHIDQYTLIDTPLPIIYHANQPDIIQLFYQVIGKNANIYVLDERGSLFCQRASFYNEETLIDHFDRFFSSVLEQWNKHVKTASVNSRQIEVMFYQINNENGSFTLSSRVFIRSTRQKRYFSVHVTSNVESGNTYFTFYCEGREFSSRQYGNTLFQEVANYILEQRRNGLSYQAYITSIDPQSTLLGTRSFAEMQMVDYLNYKKRIEDKLNEKLSLDSE